MSEHKTENFDGYGKKCLVVFGVVMVITLSMVGVFYSHLSGQPIAIALTLAAAIVNAVFVAGYLMHIVSEKRQTFLVFALTFIFFAAMMILSISARLSVPSWNYSLSICRSKAFHLVFVTALSGLTLGCTAWFLKTYAATGNKLDLTLGCLSLLAGVAVVIYGKYFLKKLKRFSYL